METNNYNDPAAFIDRYRYVKQNMIGAINLLTPQYLNWTDFLDNRESSYDEVYNKILRLNQEFMNMRDYYIDKACNDIDWCGLLVIYQVDRELADFFEHYDIESFASNNMSVAIHPTMISQVVK